MFYDGEKSFSSKRKSSLFVSNFLFYVVICTFYVVKRTILDVNYINCDVK